MGENSVEKGLELKAERPTNKQQLQAAAVKAWQIRIKEEMVVYIK